jgi:hypothetical protein
MAWYHWIAAYSIIIAGTLFTVIQHKPLWLWLTIFFLGIMGFMMVFLPHKPDKIERTLMEKYKNDKEG